MPQGRRWTVTDKAGNPVYLTDGRWGHICEGHPELADDEAAVRETIRRGRRYQDAKNPQKYHYLLRVPNLPGVITHIEAVVLFRFGGSGEDVGFPNNYVVTAYPVELR
jgi:hypothetical protein